MTDEQLHRKVESLESELSALRGELGRLVEAALEGARDARDENGLAAGDVSTDGDSPDGEVETGNAAGGDGSAGPHGAGARAQAVHDALERDIETAVRVGKRALHELKEAANRHPTGGLVAAFVGGLLLARLLGLGRRE